MIVIRIDATLDYVVQALRALDQAGIECEDRLRVRAALILANVFGVILGTVRSIEDRYGEFLDAFEAVSVAVFTVEYGLRLWTCTLKPQYASPVLGRIRYALSPIALIDSDASM